MGLIAKFGTWLDRFTEPKATVKDVKGNIDEVIKFVDGRIKHEANIILAAALDEIGKTNIQLIDDHDPRLKKVEADNLKLRDELNAIKALYKIGGSRDNVQVKPPSQLQKWDGSEPWKR